MTPRPIEIVGGGLAGLALGLALRREGIPVTLFEAGTYPRHRVCGEFISGLDARTVGRLGLEPILSGALRHQTVGWFRAGRLIRRHRLPAPALGLSRYRLDAALAEAFREAGGELRTGVRRSAPPDAEGRVIATGRKPARSPWIGLKAHVRGLRLAADLEVHLGQDCYVGLSGVEDGAVNVCGLFRRVRLPARGSGFSSRSLAPYLEASGLHALAERLGAAAVDPASFAAVAGLGVAHRVEPRPGLRIGDACGMIAPFSGDGMAMAFQSAEGALAPVCAYARGRLAWPDVRTQVGERLKRRFRVRLASAGALHPFLLRPSRQRWLAAASRARLLPLGPLYALLH